MNLQSLTLMYNIHFADDGAQSMIIVYGLFWYPRRVPHQIVAGNQSTLHSVETSLYAVVVAALAVTRGVDHLIRAVFFRYVGEGAAPLQNVGGREVEVHYEVGIVVVFRASKETRRYSTNYSACSYAFFPTVICWRWFR